jgi:ankyrin repeat protein
MAADRRGNTPLHAAARGGDPETILSVLRRDENVEIDYPNNHSLTPLHFAIMHERFVFESINALSAM